MNKKFWLKKIIGFTLLAVVIAALLGYVVMLLWNQVLAVVISGISLISFWQALGLLLLSKILFGGSRWGCGHKGGHWKQEMREKWQGMSAEEREKIKQEWRNRCRGWGAGRED
jgi:hypothetical protein